jgi:hypothetical protein
MKVLRKALIVQLLVGVFSSVLAFAYIHMSYDASMPRTPQPENGRVYPLRVNHGTRVYVNQQELDRANFVFHDVFILGVLSVLALAIIRQYWDEEKR